MMRAFFSYVEHKVPKVKQSKLHRPSILGGWSVNSALEIVVILLSRLPKGSPMSNLEVAIKSLMMMMPGGTISFPARTFVEIVHFVLQFTLKLSLLSRSEDT